MCCLTKVVWPCSPVNAVLQEPLHAELIIHAGSGASKIVHHRQVAAPMPTIQSAEGSKANQEALQFCWQTAPHSTNSPFLRVLRELVKASKLQADTGTASTAGVPLGSRSPSHNLRCCRYQCLADNLAVLCSVHS